jgi:hypothetical protein
VATLSRRVFASTLAQLGVTNITGVLAMEQNILHILVFQVRSLKDIFQISFGEAYLFDQQVIEHSGGKYQVPLSLIRTSEQ